MLDDEALLARAAELARRCEPSDTAFSVGALIVAADGALLSSGYSREGAPRAHAEEVAIAKLRDRPASLAAATLYSSMEPCSRRLSGRPSCCQLIIARGMARVVYCLDEPPVFVAGHGAAVLRDAGIDVRRLDAPADVVREVNRHLLAVQ